MRRTLPWEVNVRAGLEPEAYGPRLREIAEMDEQVWTGVDNDFLAEDKVISQSLNAAGRAHYAIKYNEFMAILEPEVVGA